MSLGPKTPTKVDLTSGNDVCTYVYVRTDSMPAAPRPPCENRAGLCSLHTWCRTKPGPPHKPHPDDFKMERMQKLLVNQSVRDALVAGQDPRRIAQDWQDGLEKLRYGRSI